LPNEHKEFLFSLSSIPFEITSKEMRACHNRAMSALLICKDLKQDLESICKTHMQKLKRICHLKNKYHVYHSIYLAEMHTRRMGNPQLLDALSSGANPDHIGNYSLSNFDPSVIADIKEIVALTPQSLDCPLGIGQLFSKVPPLFMACANDRIPLSVIAFLLEKGANACDCLSYGTRTIPIFSAIAKLEDIDFERKKEIYKLFANYGVTKESITNDRAICEKLVQSGLMLQDVSDEFKNDVNFKKARKKFSEQAPVYQDFDFAIRVIKKDHHKFKFASSTLKADPKFIIAVLEQCPSIDSDFVHTHMDQSVLESRDVRYAFLNHKNKNRLAPTLNTPAQDCCIL
jgi:hypothetical protein